MKISKKRLIEIIKEEVASQSADTKQAASNAAQFGDALIKLGKQLKTGEITDLDANEIRLTLGVLADLIKTSANNNAAGVMKQIAAIVDKKTGQ